MFEEKQTKSIIGLLFYLTKFNRLVFYKPLHLNPQKNNMEDLLQQLQEKASVTREQAEKSLHAVKEYIITKFPMLEGAVTSMFGPTVVTPAIPVSPVAPVGTPPVVEEQGVMDKIGDVTQKASDKIEDFAKNAGHKAEEMYDSAKDKLTDFFGNKRD